MHRIVRDVLGGVSADDSRSGAVYLSRWKSFAGAEQPETVKSESKRGYIEPDKEHRTARKAR